MRQYRIDDLRVEDHEKIKGWLEETFERASVAGVYWVPVEEALLTELQASHVDCLPMYMTVVLEEDHLSGELLLKTRKKMKCDCMGYADRDQRNRFIDMIDTALERLGIIN